VFCFFSGTDIILSTSGRDTIVHMTSCPELDYLVKHDMWGSKKREVCTLVFYLLSGTDIILSTCGRDTIVHTTSCLELYYLVKHDMWGSKKREVCTLVFYLLSGTDIILSICGRDTIIHMTSCPELDYLVNHDSHTCGVVKNEKCAPLSFIFSLVLILFYQLLADIILSTSGRNIIIHTTSCPELDYLVNHDGQRRPTHACQRESFILVSKKREEVCVVGTFVFYFLSGTDIILSTSGRDTIIHTTSCPDLDYLVNHDGQRRPAHACQREGSKKREEVCVGNPCVLSSLWY
jgi:hypothetical protein